MTFSSIDVDQNFLTGAVLPLLPEDEPELDELLLEELLLVELLLELLEELLLDPRKISLSRFPELSCFTGWFLGAE